MFYFMQKAPKFPAVWNHKSVNLPDNLNVPALKWNKTFRFLFELHKTRLLLFLYCIKTETVTNIVTFCKGKMHIFYLFMFFFPPGQKFCCFVLYFQNKRQFCCPRGWMYICSLVSAVILKLIIRLRSFLSIK